MPPYITPAKRDTVKKQRVVAGPVNDLDDRMNTAGAYSPGKNAKMVSDLNSGFGNPITQIGGLISKIVNWGRKAPKP